MHQSSCGGEFSHMKKRSTIPIALLVVIIAFVACYTWGVLRMGDERVDEPLTYFKDGAIGDRVYLDGMVNSVSSSYGVACVNISMLGGYPRTLQVNIYTKEDCTIKDGETMRAIGVKTDTDEMIAYMITIR